jgi:hypothetical protein
MDYLLAPFRWSLSVWQSRLVLSFHLHLLMYLVPVSTHLGTKRELFLNGATERS